MLVVAMVFWLVPPAALIAAAVWSSLAGFVPAALLATGLSAGFWMLICHGMEIPPIYGLAYPLGALMALYIILRSTWRGSEESGMARTGVSPRRGKEQRER